MQTHRLAFALATLVIVICARIVAGGQTWDDIAYHTYVAPPRLAAAEQVSARELPAWWEGAGLGVPLVAEPSHGAAYPLAWLAASPRALDWLVVAHLAWLALGIAIWARRRGAGDLAAIGAGIFAVTAGAVISSGLRGDLFGIAWLPWIGWSAEALRERRAAVVLGASLGMVALAGEPALVIDAVILACALAPALATTWRRLVPAVIAGLAIGAWQWVPAIASGLVHVGGKRIPIARLLEFVVPGSFGSYDPAHGLAAIAGAHAYLPSLYVGAGVLALASLGVTRRIAIAVVAILALGFALAFETQLAVIAVIAIARSAEGLEALFAAPPVARAVEGDVLSSRRAALRIAIAVGIMAVALVALAIFDRSHDAPMLAATLAHGGIGAACLGGAALLAWRGPEAAWRAPVLLALVVAPGVGALGVVAPLTERSVVEDAPPWVAAIGERPPPVRVYRPSVMPDLPVELPDVIATLGGTVGARWNLAQAATTDPARPALTDATWTAASHDGGALLERYGIGFAIVPGQMVAGHATLGQHGAYGLVARQAAPPAAVALDWTFATDLGATFDVLFPSKRAAIPSVIVLRGTGTPSQESSGALVSCSIQRWRAGVIDVTCASPEPGYAVVSSSATDGWSVTVDDRAQPWLVADVIRRAVAVPAGTHHIVWTYRVPGLLLGLVLAALGIAGLIALSLTGGGDPDPAPRPASVRAD
ncbi:MAG: hypothetical protein JO257_37695 [Deltaproteobacteria bacterium]|nr:hypothetical protein [Deltaproteobacteria bacterium]